MDLHMPVMDGLEATRRIRSLNDSHKSETLIIGLTANLSTASEQACIDSGMNFVITKPIDYQKLRDSIRAVVDSRLREDSRSAPVAGAEHVDFKLMHQHRDALGEHQVKSLYMEAIESIHARVGNIVHSDPQMLAYIEDEAHALAGLCSNFGLSALGRVASDIECFAQSNREDELRECVCDIAVVAERTVSDIESSI